MHALLHDERYLDLFIFWACKYFSILILQVSPEDIDLKMPQQATGTGTTKLISGHTADWALDMLVVQHEYTQKAQMVILCIYHWWNNTVVFNHIVCVFDYVMSELYQYACLHVIFVSMVHMCCRLIKCLPREGVVCLSLILSHPLDRTHWGHHKYHELGSGLGFGEHIPYYSCACIFLLIYFSLLPCFPHVCKSTHYYHHHHTVHARCMQCVPM